MKINRKNGLHSVHGIDGKQITGILIRMPHTKSNTKFPSKLGAVHDSKGQRIRGLWWRTPHGPFVAQITDRTPEGIVRSIKVSLKADTLARRPGKMAMEPLSTLVTLLHVFDCRFNKIGGVARKGAIISLNG